MVKPTSFTLTASKAQKGKMTMKKYKHILLGAVMAIVLFCSFGFYDTEIVSDGTLRYFGSDRDVSFEFDGTNFEIFAIAADTPWAIGGTSYGFDITYNFETEGTIAIDYDGDTVKLSDTISAVFGSDGDWTIGSSTTKILQLTPLGDETYAIYVGADTAGADLKIFGADTGEYLHYDSSAGSLLLYSTSTSTSGGTSIQPVYSYCEMTGAGGVGGRANFHTFISAKMAGWTNALKGYIDFDTDGCVTGLASAVLAEMRLPAGNLATLGGGGLGTYGVLELELVCQSGGSTGGVAVAYQYMAVSGDETSCDDWDDNGYIWNIQGLEDATGNVFDTDTSPGTDATLRILIGSTPYYILLSDSPTS